MNEHMWQEYVEIPLRRCDAVRHTTHELSSLSQRIARFKASRRIAPFSNL